MSNRLNQEREKELQPKRMQTAKAALLNIGFLVIYEDETRIEFYHNNEVVRYYPYSGWHTGKSIKDGRGLQHLLKQLI